MKSLIILYLVYVSTLPLFGESHHNACRLNLNDERVIAWKKSAQKYERTRIEVGGPEQLALRTLYRDIENAYTNNQVETMTRAMDCVSNRVDRVQDALYRELKNDIERILAERFLLDNRRSEFSSVADFERFAETHMKMALFLGDCYCRRNDYDGGLMSWIECQTLDALKRYEDYFRKEQRKDFEERARRFLDMWIAHIESNEGFTRRFAHYDADMSWPSIRLGKITPEQVRHGALRKAKALIRCGYTPKWLDDFLGVNELKLKALYHDIENAYTNEQAEAMKQAMARVLDHSGRSQGQSRPPFILDYVFTRLFNERFKLKEFDSLPEFERFLSVNLEMALFLCSCDYEGASSRDFELRELECRTFKILKKYADKCHEAGRSDFEAVVQKFMGIWIAHIESDQAFVHRFAYYYGGRREGACFAVREIIRLGYTPKWLDDFK